MVYLSGKKWWKSTKINVTTFKNTNSNLYGERIVKRWGWSLCKVIETTRADGKENAEK